MKIGQECDELAGKFDVFWQSENMNKKIRLEK